MRPVVARARCRRCSWRSLWGAHSFGPLSVCVLCVRSLGPRRLLLVNPMRFLQVANCTLTYISFNSCRLTHFGFLYATAILACIFCLRLLCSILVASICIGLRLHGKYLHFVDEMCGCNRNARRILKNLLNDRDSWDVFGGEISDGRGKTQPMGSG